MSNVIITGFLNPTNEGIVLHLNKKTSLKTGNVVNDEFWVSWDKIGSSLFDGYTEKKEVSERNELRNKSDIEKAADDYSDKHGFRIPYDGSNKFYNDDDVKWSKEGFIAGALWQRESSNIEAIDLLGWLTENFFQRRTNGFSKRDDENPPNWQRLYTIHEIKDLYIQSLKQIKS